MLCAKFGWNWPSGSGEDHFEISSMYLCYFVIIFPWKKVWPFICRKLNSLHRRVLSAKFVWNWSSGSREEHFEISSMYFCHFVMISPWKKVWPFICRKFNSLHRGILCANKVWLKLDKAVLEKILKCCQCIF